jgi:hypothetical protein
MKRIKSNYHHLKELKRAKPQLRKVINKNCNSELVKTINLQLSTCQKRLRKLKVPLRAVADRSVSLEPKKKIINLRGGFIIPLLSSILPTIASFIFRSRDG